MVFNSMQFLRDAMRYEEKLMSSLRQKAVEIEESYAFTPDVREKIAEDLRELENASLHHEEILNYWIEQINAGNHI